MKQCIISFLLAGGLLMLAQSCTRRTATDTTDSRRAQYANLTPDERADRLTRQMTRQLSLSASQVPIVAAVNLTCARQMQPLIERGDRSAGSLRELRRINAAKENDLRTVLTASQMQQYLAQQQTRQDKVRRGRAVP